MDFFSFFSFWFSSFVRVRWQILFIQKFGCNLSWRILIQSPRVTWGVQGKGPARTWESHLSLHWGRGAVWYPLTNSLVLQLLDANFPLLLETRRNRCTLVMRSRPLCMFRLWLSLPLNSLVPPATTSIKGPSLSKPVPRIAPQACSARGVLRGLFFKKYGGFHSLLFLRKKLLYSLTISVALPPWGLS